MKRMGLMLTLAAVLLPLAYKAAKKHRLSRKPVVVLDMDVVAERSLPGRAAAQYIRTVKNILHRSVEETRLAWQGREQTPEGIRAISQAQSNYQQQLALYQKKLDNEIGDIVGAAVRSWLSRNKHVAAVVPADETLGYNKTADITRQIMAEVDWYKPSFPPLPRTRANRAVL